MATLIEAAQIGSSPVAVSISDRIKSNPIYRTANSHNQNNQTLFAPDLLKQCLEDKSLRDFTGDLAGVAVALPERLVGLLAASFIAGRKKSKQLGLELVKDESFLPSAQLEIYQALAGIAQDSSFVAFNPKADLRKVLLGHPLSAVGDWLGLLADIGRASRAALAFQTNLEVLVGGVTWMHDNRSFYQFVGKSLSESDLEKGLCLNSDSRRRLYESLGITMNLQDIYRYGNGQGLAGAKLQEIASFYNRLAEVLYGVVDGAISPEMAKVIAGKQLNLASKHLPDSLRLLLECEVATNDTNNPHLEILARVANQFKRLDTDVFRYFFAQWFAQEQYRGSAFKCAVFTERPFDRLFDDLDIQIKNKWCASQSNISRPSPLAAAYFPHYRIGKLQVLPYNPLSLDVLRAKLKSHKQLENLICPLDGSIDRRAVVSLLTDTPPLDRNRLLYDLVSFLMLCQRKVPEAISDACRNLGLWELADVVALVCPEAATSLKQELEIQGNAGQLWTGWLEALQAGGTLPYTPVHIQFLLLDTSAQATIEKSVNIVLLAHDVYQRLTERNWLRAKI
jgi:hypothetical protein